MRRRKFISCSIRGISGAAIVSSSVVPLLASCSGAGKKINLGLVGCNAESVNLISMAFRDIQNVGVKSIFDFDKEKVGEASLLLEESLGHLPEQAPDMQTIFNDPEINGVFIFLPEHWRAQAVLQACQANKDVFVESIPSHTIAEGKQIAEEADNHKRVVQCGFSLRSAPSVLAAQRYIANGELGQVLQIKVFSLQELSQPEARQDTDIPDGLDWNSWLGHIQYRPYSPEIYSRERPDGWKAFMDFGSGRMTWASNGLDVARLLVGDPPHPLSVYGYWNQPKSPVRNELPERQVVTYDYGKFTMYCEIGNTYGYMKKTPVSFDGETVLPLQWLLRPNRVEIYGANGLMYVDSVSGDWQVQGNSGKVLAWEKGSGHQTLHIQNFIDGMRSRELPSANIGQGHLSAALVHLGNIACRVGNKQLLFDPEKEIFTNNEEANSLSSSKLAAVGR